MAWCSNRSSNVLATTGSPEGSSPLAESAVGGQDECTTFIARVDELKEQVGATRLQREVTNFVNDQQRITCVERQTFFQLPGAFSFCQRGDDVSAASRRTRFCRTGQLQDRERPPDEICPSPVVPGNARLRAVR